MAHILVTTDLSDASLHAAAYAVKVFGRSGHRWSILHAYAEAAVMDPALAMSLPTLLKEADKELVGFTDRFVRVTGADSVQRQLLYGALAPLLVEKATREKVDLVVIGRQGQGSSFFGSNAVDVIKRSHVPVLVVPASAPIEVPKKILLADDYGDVRVRDLSMLREIAMVAKAEVLVGHHVERVAEGLPHWSHGIYELALKDVPHSFITAQGDRPVEGLEKLAELHQADMIAVLHRHIGILARLFTPSTSKELALNARFPLLVLEQAGA